MKIMWEGGGGGVHGGVTGNICEGRGDGVKDDMVKNGWTRTVDLKGQICRHLKLKYRLEHNLPPVHGCMKEVSLI